MIRLFSAASLLLLFCSKSSANQRERGCNSRNCMKYSLMTEAGQITVGCTAKCGDVWTKAHTDGEQCINVSYKAASKMKEGIKYFCPLGICDGPVCQPSGLLLRCWSQGFQNLGTLQAQML
ncbi:uncharacterized protein LOC144121764 isoform X1 [Amblyomma americanum]